MRLFDLSELGDKHIKTLVTRCNKITDLNLGGWNSTTRQSLNFIIENLKLTLVRLTYVPTFDLIKLDRMENVRNVRLQ